MASAQDYVPRTRVAKAPKDPNKPKRKMSPFDIFRNEQISEFKRLHPETKVDLGVFMRNLSQTWNSLDDTKKIPYTTEADKDAGRFQAEMANYVPDQKYLQPKQKKRKRVKEVGEPKRAMTAFMFFSNTTRSEVVKVHPELKIGGIAKILGEKWNNMNEEEKAPYQEMTNKDRERFAAESEIFKANKLAKLEQLQDQNGDSD